MAPLSRTASERPPQADPDARSFWAERALAAGQGCPRCAEPRAYSLADGRRRCPACGYTHTLFTGRWITRCRLAPDTWLAALELFVAQASAREAATILKVKYDTAHRAFTTLRLAILAQVLGEGDLAALLDDNGELRGFCPNLDRPDDQALCQGCHSYVFSLRAVGGDGVALALAPDLKAREVLAWPVVKKHWHSFIHTDRHRGHDALIFSCCRRGRELFSRGFTSAVTRLDTMGPFKSFADDLFATYRGVSPEAYPLYLAEAVFRHQCDEERLLPALADLLCAFVPAGG